MAGPGDAIIMEMTLHDFATDKYVRAVVRAEGVELPWSPVTLNHIGGGTYFRLDDINFIFPDTDPETRQVTVTYEVYEDAAFTTRSKCHGPYKETLGDTANFTGGVVITDPRLLERLEEVKNLIITFFGVQGIVEEIPTPEIEGLVCEMNPSVVGEVQDEPPPELQGIVCEPDQTIVGLIEDDNTVIVGTTEE